MSYSNELLSINNSALNALLSLETSSTKHGSIHLVRGIPGSGKSTLIQNILGERLTPNGGRFLILDPDIIPLDLPPVQQHLLSLDFPIEALQGLQFSAHESIKLALHAYFVDLCIKGAELGYDIYYVRAFSHAENLQNLLFHLDAQLTDRNIESNVYLTNVSINCLPGAPNFDSEREIIWNRIQARNQREDRQVPEGAFDFFVGEERKVQLMILGLQESQLLSNRMHFVDLNATLAPEQIVDMHNRITDPSIYRESELNV